MSAKYVKLDYYDYAALAGLMNDLDPAELSEAETRAKRRVESIVKLMLDKRKETGGIRKKPIDTLAKAS